MTHLMLPVAATCERCGVSKADMLAGASLACHGPITHEERMEIIHRPFFITYFQRSYPWGGIQTGGYMFADISGGRQVSLKGLQSSAMKFYRADDSVTGIADGLMPNPTLDTTVTVDDVIAAEDAEEGEVV